MKTCSWILCVLMFIWAAFPQSVSALQAPLSEKVVQTEAQQSIDAGASDSEEEDEPAPRNNLQPPKVNYLADSLAPSEPDIVSVTDSNVLSGIDDNAPEEETESPVAAIDDDTPEEETESPVAAIDDDAPAEETEPVSFSADEDENEQEQTAPQEADNPVNPVTPPVTPGNNPVSINYSTNDNTGQARLTGTTFSPACSGVVASLAPSGSGTCSVTLRISEANGVPRQTTIRLFTLTAQSAALNAMRTAQLMGQVVITVDNIGSYISQAQLVRVPLPGTSSSLNSVLGIEEPAGSTPRFSDYADDRPVSFATGFIRLSMPGSTGTAQNVGSLRFVFDPANPNRLTKLEFVDTMTAAGNVLFSVNVDAPSDTVPGLQELLARQNVGEAAADAAEEVLEDQMDDQGNLILGLLSLADAAEAKRDAAEGLLQQIQNSRSQTRQTPEQIQQSINTRNQMAVDADTAAREARAFAAQARREVNTLRDSVASASTLPPEFAARIQAAYGQAQTAARRAETAASDAEYNAQQARDWANSMNRDEVLRSVTPALINMAGSAAVIPGDRDAAAQAQTRALAAFNNLQASNNGLNQIPPSYPDIPTASSQLQGVRAAAESASSAAEDARSRFDARNAEVQPLLDLINRLDPNARDTELQAARTSLAAQLENIRSANQATQDSRTAVNALLEGAVGFFNRIEATRPPPPAPPPTPEVSPSPPPPIVPNPRLPLHEITQFPWPVRFQLLGGEQNVTGPATSLELQYTTTAPSFFSSFLGTTSISRTNINVNGVLSSPNYRFFPDTDQNALIAAGFRPDQLNDTVTVDGQTYIRISTPGNSSYFLDAAGNLLGVMENNNDLRFISGGNQGTVEGFMVNNRLIRTNDGSGGFDYSRPGEVYWVQNFNDYSSYRQALPNRRAELDSGSYNPDDFRLPPPGNHQLKIRYRII